MSFNEFDTGIYYLNLDKLKSLVKIELTEEEESAAGNYFDFWVEKFNGLKKIDTENIEPLINVSSLENIMREDTAYKIFTREELLENAPEHCDGYFAVPRIIE